MPAATIKITDITQQAQNIFNLLTTPSLPGYTVTPTPGEYTPSLTMTGCVAYLSVQASYTNGGSIVYEGDANVKANGTLQGKELAAGDTDVHQAYSYSVNLNEIYLMANTNGALINLEWHYA